MKVFANKERSGWILDDIHRDFVNYSRHEITNKNPDVCFVINPWGLEHIRKKFKSSKILTFLHHIDTRKLNMYKFDRIESSSDLIIVPNRFTYDECVKHISEEKVKQLSYWVLEKRTAPKNENNDLREKLSPNGEILIGSFQKDSEGKTGKPKLSKGPDVFVDLVSKISKKENVKVILSGHNRKYVISELKKREIPYEFFKSYRDLNELYDCLDVSFVTSRREGGPRAVLEASARRVPILSTDVGMASDVLDPRCICDNVDDYLAKYFNRDHDKCVEENYKNVQEFLPSKIISKFDDYLEEIL
jgi:glycosyltransferase involved in cell wall biosynthesis